MDTYLLIDITLYKWLRDWRHFLFVSFLVKITKYQGPGVQIFVSLTSSLVVKMLTVLVSTVANSQVFLLKNVSSFFFQQKY